MSVPIDCLAVLNWLILLALATSIGWLWLRTWYFRLVSNARDRIYDRDGKKVLGATPQMLLGNITDVYSAENQLSAYHAFHQKFGEVVQFLALVNA